MDRLEDLRVLDAESGQRVDVEEPAVIDLVRGRAPVGETVGLRLEQLVQPVEAPARPGVPLNGAISCVAAAPPGPLRPDAAAGAGDFRDDGSASGRAAARYTAGGSAAR